MSPAHNLVISLLIVSTHQFCGQKFSWPKRRINLALPRNRTRLTVAGAPCHNHHATTYSWVSNFRVCAFPPTSPGLLPHPYTRWRQGRHVWQIVRKLPMEAGWRDAPLTHLDLAVSNLHDLSFISTQFFVLNLDGWFDELLSNKFIIFWYSIIILLY